MNFCEIYLTSVVDLHSFFVDLHSFFMDPKKLKIWILDYFNSDKDPDTDLDPGTTFYLLRNDPR